MPLRMACMFTMWMWSAFLVAIWLGVDVAATGLPHVAWLIFLATRKLAWTREDDIALELRASLPSVQLSMSTWKRVVFAADLAAHVAPLFLFGLPLVSGPLWWGAALAMLGWYVLMRPHIPRIYVRRFSHRDSDEAVIAAVSAAFVFGLVAHVHSYCADGPLE